MLLKKLVRKEFLHTSGDGKNHKIKYYYLDDII
jgi:predicted transcriptional regulator